RILNVPNPRTSMFCCSWRASLIASRKASTTRAQSFFEISGPLVRAIDAVTRSTRSALVMKLLGLGRPVGDDVREPNLERYLLCVKRLEHFGGLRSAPSTGTR